MAFEILETVNLPFKLTIAILKLESGTDGCVILLEINAKVAVESGNAAGEYILQPPIQFINP